MRHRFVEFLPDKLDSNTLYISMQYATATHLCCCGCKQEVVTPLSPTDWKLIFDGESISLHPSIGNWSFPCRSHYFIKGSNVVWANKWSQAQIDKNRSVDQKSKNEYFSDKNPPKISLLQRLLKWFE